MQRFVPPISSTRAPPGAAGAWLARRWYYTPKSRRAYSVREISAGDRRLLNELSVLLVAEANERDRVPLQSFTALLLERVLGADHRPPPANATAFMALENVAGVDRAIGGCAYAPAGPHCSEFSIAVTNSFRAEQVGKTLLETMLRHVRRVGIERLEAELAWSNRAMLALATSLGFSIEAMDQDRTRRRVLLALR